MISSQPKFYSYRESNYKLKLNIKTLKILKILNLSDIHFFYYLMENKLN